MVCFALVAPAAGCATIMDGGPDHIPVASNPPGAAVYLDGQMVGTTPMVVVLDRQRSHGNIQIVANGYAPVVVQRDKSINGWFWANLCLGGLVGMVVDAVTGNITGFDDSGIAVGLTPVAGGQPPAYAQPPMGQPGYPPAGPQGYPQPPQGYPPGPPPPPPTSYPVQQ
ncbi:MAG TPA: PEGA domain-containing protein [Kofleriaceae bacterium]